MRTVYWCPFVAAVLCVRPFAVAQSGVGIRPIALTGQPAFGLPDELIVELGLPSVNASGDLLFAARTRSGPTTTHWNLFHLQPGGVDRVARSGEAIAGHPLFRI